MDGTEQSREEAGHPESALGKESPLSGQPLGLLPSIPSHTPQAPCLQVGPALRAEPPTTQPPPLSTICLCGLQETPSISVRQMHLEA